MAPSSPDIDYADLRYQQNAKMCRALRVVQEQLSCYQTSCGAVSKSDELQAFTWVAAGNGHSKALLLMQSRKSSCGSVCVTARLVPDSYHSGSFLLSGHFASP